MADAVPPSPDKGPKAIGKTPGDRMSQLSSDKSPPAKSISSDKSSPARSIMQISTNMIQKRRKFSILYFLIRFFNQFLIELEV